MHGIEGMTSGMKGKDAGNPFKADEYSAAETVDMIPEDAHIPERNDGN